MGRSRVYRSSGTVHLLAINRRLQAEPKEAAIKIAARAASEITRLAQESYDSGQTAYGDARKQGVRGPLTLVKSGWTRANVRFVSDGGSKIRCSLGKPYVKYLIGKYTILPSGNQALPWAWQVAIDKIAREELARHFAARGTG
jgi:hypothetical protein